MLIGCCISNTEDIPRVQAAGYDYFEFSGAKLAAMSEEEFGALLLTQANTGLPCLGLNSYCSGVPAFVGDDFSPEQAADYAEKLCARAAELGVRTIGIGAPAARRLPIGYPLARADAQMREFLGITAEIAWEYGIYVMLEALHEHCCNYINTVSQALDLLQAATLGSVGIVLDFYHMQVMEEGLDLIPKAAPWLLHTHVSSCGEKLERGFPGMEELSRYTEIVKALWDVDYDATMSVEAAAFDPVKAPETLRMLRKATGIEGSF